MTYKKFHKLAEGFLRKHKVLTAFKRNIKGRFKSLEECTKTLYKERSKTYLISGTFSWDRIAFWSNLDDEWTKFIRKHMEDNEKVNL